MNVGACLREWRLRAGLTQARAAELAGVSQPSIGAYETGKTAPGLGRLESLARIYGARSVTDLLSSPGAE